MTYINLRDELQNLRDRAERRQLVASVPMTEPDAQRLVQELQVHQIELEMQYEELLLAQADAEASRAEYLDLYDFAPVGYCTLATDGTLVQLNLRLAQLLGAVRQRLVRRRLALFVVPADRHEFSQFLARLWAVPGQRNTCELALQTDPNAPLVYVQLVGLVGALTEEGLAAVPAMCRLAIVDVTARRAATDKLAASEARFRAAFEQSFDGQVLLRDLCLADVNGAALRLLGCSGKAVVLGCHLSEFWPDDQPGGRSLRTCLAECLQQVQAQGWCRYEWRRYTAAGEPRWDELSFNPVLVQGQDLLHMAWRDITDRKLNEQRLHESEERLGLALDASETGTFTWDTERNQVLCDAKILAIYGLAYTPAPIAAEVLIEMTHPADTDRLHVAITESLDSGRLLAIRYRVVRTDASVRHISLSARRVSDGQGQTAFAGVLSDVTTLMTTTEDLRFKNRLLDHILRHLPMVLTRFSSEGRLLSVTGAGLRRLGLAGDELAGPALAELAPNEIVDTQLSVNQPNGQLVAFTHQGRPVYFLTYDFRDDEYQEGIRVSIDVTEAELLKEEATRLRVRQQQEVLSAVLGAQEEERRRVAEALHNGVGQLLYATRLHLEGLPFSEPVQASQRLLADAIRATRNLSHELTLGILEDFGLATALRELAKRIPATQLAVDLNLQNLDAPLSPSLATAVYRIVQELLSNVMKHAQAREVFVQVAREDNLLHLSVEDDGIGYDANCQELQPGIGLAGIRTRATTLGGTLTIRSRPGRGTGVFLVLPVMQCPLGP